MKEESLEVMDEEFEEKKTFETIRRGFIRKVYGIILFQLLITTTVIYFSMTNEILMKFMLSNVWPLYLSCVASITVVIILVCGKLTRTVPVNYFLLIVLTLLEAFMASYTTIYFQPISVLVCAGLTMLIVFALTMYACFTKRDMTMMGGFLFCFSIILIFLGIVGFFFTSYFYQMFLNSLGVLLMSLYLIFDTQLVVGNKRNLIDVDDYILGALNIYLDIISLFLRILKLFGKKNNN
jgi:FtsH-binding integral membrane protein